MRLLVMSDLHIESTRWSPRRDLPEFDVAVLAGDIASSPREAIEWASAQPGLARRPIVFVAGNHEFYRGVIEDRLAEGREAAARCGVTFLDRDSAIIASVRFVGATLWTDYDLFVGLRRDSLVYAAAELTDHRLVKTRPPGVVEKRRRFPFRPIDARARHMSDLACIESVLDEPFDGTTVVVTHHAPHPGSVAARFANDMLTSAFVSDLTTTIERWRPSLWIHGHTHDSFDYRVGGTRIVCNPRGYGAVCLENLRFDPQKVVDV